MIQNYSIDHVDCEDLWIKLHFNSSETLLVCVFYRHPKLNFNDFANKIHISLSKVSADNLNCVLLGDANIDLKKINTCNKTRSYSNMLSSNSFHSLIDFPRRVTAKSQTIIDHVYSNLCRYKIIPGIIKSSLTDHYPLLVILNHTKLNVEQTTFYTRSLKKFNFENFDNDLKLSLDKQLSDSPKLDENNFDQVFSTFMEIIKITIVHRHAPLRKLTRRQKRLNKKPWITNGILISIKKKTKTV